MEAKLKENMALIRTIRVQYAGVERQITNLKLQLEGNWSALEKLVGELPLKGDVLRGQALAVELALDTKIVPAKHFKRGIAAKAEKRQQSLAGRRKTSETATRQVRENGEFLLEVQFNVATVTAET